MAFFDTYSNFGSITTYLDTKFTNRKLYQSIKGHLSIKTIPRTHLGRSYLTTHLCYGHIMESLVPRKPMWLEQ